MAQAAALRRDPGFKRFSQHFLARRHVHHLFGQQRLELRVLSLKRLQLLGVRHFHTAILGSPFVKRRITDAMPATQLLCAKPSLMLLQYPNNLFFAETASLRRLSPSWRTG